MANARLTLSQKGTERLDKVMAELVIIEERSEAIRIVLAKGISEATEEPPEYGGGGWTIPAGVLAKNDEYLLYKHLMIEKIGKPIDGQKEIDSYLLRFVEFGLEVMEKEIQSLSNLDNYILKLVESAK